jgi:hypothetical protein
MHDLARDKEPELDEAAWKFPARSFDRKVVLTLPSIRQQLS